ncbi:MAG: (d)CMP kinase [candidate division Zixibacteria bacterium]|nr:(d)CMP kinase [candidate division Zixibacteria bacterium]
MDRRGGEEPVIVALDGPAASGKSTVGLAVARSLKFNFVETGKLYRALALKALREGLALDDGPALARLFGGTRVTYEFRGGKAVVEVDGEDVAAELARAEVAEAASAISAIGEVREVLLPLQRALARAPGVVVEGRDIGSVVFPNATYKFYLDASVAERARRRARDFAAAGQNVDIGEVERGLAARDERDAAREAAPLRRAEDAVYVDTTDVAFDEVVSFIVNYVRNAEEARAER